MYNIKKRELNKETYDFCIKEGFNKLQSTILAKRELDKEFIKKLDNLNYRDLQSRDDMYNIDKAADLIIKHIKNKSFIVLLSDYDVDGLTSASVMYKFFKDFIKYDKTKFDVVINKRDFGNGVNDKIVDKILHNYNNIDLIITADQGSADEDRYKRLRKKNIDILVTDHHTLPETGVPKSANVFVNPQQPKCKYDKSISGCAVIYFVLERVWEKLYPERKKEIMSLLDYVAVSTIADNMALSSINNRILFRRGFMVLNKMYRRTPWKVLNYTDQNAKLIDETYISFNISPRINSTSRLDNEELGFKFLVEDDIKKSFTLLEQIDLLNKRRKDTQTKIYNGMLLDLIKDKETVGVVKEIKEGKGLQGVIASMIGTNFNKPSIVLLKKDNVMLGSGRGNIDDFDLKGIINKIHEKDNEILIRYGGHKEAIGLEIAKDRFEDFCKLFDDFCKIELEGKSLKKTLWIDKELNPSEIDLDMVRDLDYLSPFGRTFEAPIFKSKLIIRNVKNITNGMHSIITFMDKENKKFFKSIYINSNLKSGDLRKRINEEVDVYYKININSFLDNVSLQLFIEYLE